MVGLAKAMGISSRNLTPWTERISIDSLEGRKGKKKGENPDAEETAEASLCAHPTPTPTPHYCVGSLGSNTECHLTRDGQSAVSQGSSGH